MRHDRLTVLTAIMTALDDPDFAAWLESTGNEVHPANAVDTAAAVIAMTAFYDQFKHLLN